MDKNEITGFEPDYLVRPGEMLASELEAHNMSQSELAKRTGLSEKHIVDILKGNNSVSITPHTAIKLQGVLGWSAEFWLNFEASYQATKARLAQDAQLVKDLSWLQRIPVNNMVKLGWLQRHRDKKQQLREVLDFFGIASVAQWSKIWPNVPVAYRQHQKFEIYPEAVSAWLRKGEIEAGSIECQPFDKSIFRQALTEVRSITRESNPEKFIPLLQQSCAKSGVAVVFVPNLPKVPVSGATRWINSDKAVIQLSLRYKIDDNLWFTFFHEAGHVLLHGKKELFFEGTDVVDGKKEEEANKFAERELLPRKSFRQFVEQSVFSKSAIRQFADEVGIAPGIVVGQLQHRELLPRSYCNDLKVRYRWSHDQ